ncbi:MAG TPA: DnaJ C-terminal domain-containing protein [Oxalicibacterium sp.]
MKFKDYYETLGIKRDATQDEIKNAYRKLARKYHPDVSKQDDAEERFKEVGEAYKVLKDPESRSAYDRLGANWQNGQDFQPPPGAASGAGGFEFHSNGGGFEGMDFGDFFEQMFSRQAGHGGHRAHGTRSTHTMRMAGEDHHAKVQIELEDAYHGAERSISLRLPEVDEQGHVVHRTRTLSVNIPKGIRAGQNLRLAGQGGAGIGGGPAGDLYLEIAFRPHPHYRIDGSDVYMDLPLAPWEAALGATVTANTPAGAVELTIPPNSAAGRKLRLKGKGIPGKEAGNLYVVLAIALPRAETDSEKEAYRAFQNAFDFHPRAK